MIENEIVLALKNRYNYLSPLLLARSIERANNETELFDILDSIPKDKPVAWCFSTKRWVPASLFKNIIVFKVD